METINNDNPSDCQAAAADSTTAAVGENSTVVDPATTIALSMISEEATQQVSSTTVSSQTTAKTIALPAPTNNSPTPPQSSNNNNNNGSNNNKLKSQQSQQQQQYHQFRAPQQFVRHKKSTSSLTKKNKTWNKRQNKTTKQQQNFTISAAPGAGGAAIIAGGCQIVSGGGSIINVGGASVGVGSSAGGGTLPTTKADLENIQNFKNQLGVGGGNHHYYHNHHGHHGISLPSSSLVGGVEKLGYGHGHLKQQLCKKMLMHRGHHHHVLCAGVAHNTLGVGANVSCCLINGCSGQNLKDNSGGVGGCGVSAVTIPNTTGIPNTLHYCCGRSKFFLPGNRLRKEAIIPPTKFLLGGNISDPLNLNSLQNETSNASSNNNTPATTPRQSPITTPPKVEVIIPPNIHDPLHLLDPVDSMEYEKQLTSPMKRGGPRGSNKQHHKHHRHRKNRKPKRRRYESFTSTSTTGALEITDDISSLANSTISTEASSSALSISLLDSSGVGGGISSMNNSTIAPTAAVEFRAQERDESVLSSSLLSAEKCTERNALLLSPRSGALPQQQALNSTIVAVGERDGIVVADAILPRERERQRAIRDLRLDLNSTSSSTCGGAIGNMSASILYGSVGAGGVGGGGGRKRKISESNNSQKNKKFHRLDSMDKIVSPVVPQPGAWKRPPRVVPSGARKTLTRRSTSVSESELLSPVDDVSKTLQPEAETLHVDTPDLKKVETISEVGLGTPLILNATATSVVAGELNIVADTNAGDSSTTILAKAADESNNKAAEESPLSTAITTTTTPVKQLVKMPKFRADGAKYRYGNYDRYTGFRHLNEFMDVRLQVFQRHLELFQNKDILDIGCNVGHMTITVARNLAPKSILGIDIDKELISRARRNLALYVRIPHDPIKKEDAAVVGGGAKIEECINGGGSVTETSISNVPPSAYFNKKFKKKNPRKDKQCSQDTIMHHTHYQHRILHHYHSHHHYQMHQQHMQKQQQLKLHVPAKELFPVSFPLNYGGIPTTQTHHFGGEPTSPVYTSTSTPGHPSNSSATPSNYTNYSSTKSKNDFPRNVFFRQTNYVLKDESLLCNDTQQYDLIMCLSVTKWIHLNFGDAGLKLAFKRMFNQLRPGGKLILEAQNWASYKKKKNLTEEIYNNYRNIEFFPNKFHEYLLSSDVGFSHSYTLGVPRHLSKGFCRPIQLYAKGDYTPNHVRWSDAYYPQTPYEAYRGIYATMPPRPAGMASYAMSSTRSQTYDTPHYTGGTSGPYSCRQTPMHQLTSQYYNPLETDSYLPSYDMEYLNHMYVFASPLYQTVWSPPASLRNSSSHTPAFGSVRDAELDGDGIHRHVYPPNDDTSSPNANAGGAFNSIRDADTDDSNPMPASNVQHVYATNCGESSSSPQVHHHDSETIDGLMLDEDPNGIGATAAAVASGGVSSAAGSCCDLNNE